MKLPQARRGLWIECALPCLLVGLYLFVGTRQLTRPGLWWDEGDTAAYGMELALDLPRSDTDWSVRLAGRTWPLRARDPYDFCALPIYWSALAFKAAGVSVFVLRLSAVIVAAAALAVFYALCRFWLGIEAAFAAGLLLAVNPAFVLMSRLGYWAPEFPLALLALAVLALMSLWHRRRRVWALYAAAFCFGLTTSVTTKAIAFLISFPVLYVALVPRKHWPSLRQVAGAAVCAALGAADFIAYNAARGMPIVRFLLDSLTAPTLAGADNSAVARNLATRGGQLLRLLDGTTAADSAAGRIPRDAVLPVFFAAAAAALIWRCASRKPFRARGFVLLVLGLLALSILETAFTPSDLGPQHLLVLWPYVFIPVAAALDWTRTEIDRRRPGKGTLVAAALLALPVVSALRVDAAYFSRLEKTGGEMYLSDSINDLANYLDRLGIRTPICLSWGISRNVYLITGGRVIPIEAHRFHKGVTPELLAAYAAFAADPAARFICLVGDQADLLREYLEAFRVVVKNIGRRLVIEKEFPDGAGRTMYVVLRVEKKT